MMLQALALQKLDHPYVCGYKEFFVMWDKEVPHNSVCPAICLSACLCRSRSVSVSLWFCLPVSVCLTLCLSCFHSVWFCLSHSLPLSLSVSLCLSDSVCMSVCLCLSLSLPVSLSLCQILSTSSIIFSYSLILTCFFLIPVLVPWFCAIQKVFIIIIIIKWKFTQEVLNKSLCQAAVWNNKMGKKQVKVLKPIGLFRRPDNGQGKQFQAAGQADEATVWFVVCISKKHEFYWCMTKEDADPLNSQHGQTLTDLPYQPSHKMCRYWLTFSVKLHTKCADTDWP